MKVKKNKGITLVVLVVTIAVLIILSTVSITALFGENGILRQARETKNKATSDIEKDEEELNRIMQEYNNAMAEPPEPEKPALPEGTITFEGPTWSGGKANVVVKTSATGYTLQYQIGGIAGQWINIASGGTITGLANGQIVYAVIYNGTNRSEPTSTKIQDKNPPTITSFAETSHNENSIAVKVIANDNETGLATAGAYKYYLNETEIQASETNTFTYTGLTQSTAYTLKVVVTDKAENTSEKTITVTTDKAGLTSSDIDANPSLIGKYVNYGGASTYKGVRWRIFNTENNQIQLIADNYVSGTYLPTATNITISDSKVYASGYRGILINYINTTSNWSSFAVNGATAKGGPSLEQFISSYNRTHNSSSSVPKLYYATKSGMMDGLTGYYVGTSANPTYTFVNGLNTTEMQNLYVVNSTANANGYWLGSASASDPSAVINVRYNGVVNHSGYSFTDYGLRPLVTLPSSVKLVEQADGTFNIR